MTIATQPCRVCGAEDGHYFNMDGEHAPLGPRRPPVGVSTSGADRAPGLDRGKVLTWLADEIAQIHGRIAGHPDWELDSTDRAQLSELERMIDKIDLGDFDQ